MDCRKLESRLEPRSAAADGGVGGAALKTDEENKN
jgi:hypothetical protein